jgi:hypothetical protein
MADKSQWAARIVAAALMLAIAFCIYGMATYVMPTP